MLTTISSLVGIVKELDGLLGGVRYKLFNSPTDASEKLAEALNELGLVLEFVEKELVRYLEIQFLDDRSNFLACRSALLSMESGYGKVKGYEARGHCHKIVNIYDKYLDHWFNSVLDSTEAGRIKNLFYNMNAADDVMVMGINELTLWLMQEAEAVLQLADSDQLAIANDRIKQARLDVKQTRKDVVEALSAMKLMEASLIVSLKTV